MTTNLVPVQEHIDVLQTDLETYEKLQEKRDALQPTLKLHQKRRLTVIIVLTIVYAVLGFVTYAYIDEHLSLIVISCISMGVALLLLTLVITSLGVRLFMTNTEKLSLKLKSQIRQHLRDSYEHPPDPIPTCQFRIGEQYYSGVGLALIDDEFSVFTDSWRPIELKLYGADANKADVLRSISVARILKVVGFEDEKYIELVMEDQSSYIIRPVGEVSQLVHTIIQLWRYALNT